MGRSVKNKDRKFARGEFSPGELVTTSFRSASGSLLRSALSNRLDGPCLVTIGYLDAKLLKRLAQVRCEVVEYGLNLFVTQICQRRHRCIPGECDGGLDARVGGPALAVTIGEPAFCNDAGQIWLPGGSSRLNPMLDGLAGLLGVVHGAALIPNPEAGSYHKRPSHGGTNLRALKFHGCSLALVARGQTELRHCIAQRVLAQAIC